MPSSADLSLSDGAGSRDRRNDPANPPQGRNCELLEWLSQTYLPPLLSVLVRLGMSENLTSIAAPSLPENRARSSRRRTPRDPRLRRSRRTRSSATPPARRRGSAPPG